MIRFKAIARPRAPTAASKIQSEYQTMARPENIHVKDFLRVTAVVEDHKGLVIAVEAIEKAIAG